MMAKLPCAQLEKPLKYRVKQSFQRRITSVISASSHNSACSLARQDRKTFHSISSEPRSGRRKPAIFLIPLRKTITFTALVQTVGQIFFSQYFLYIFTAISMMSFVKRGSIIFRYKYSWWLPDWVPQETKDAILLYSAALMVSF